MKTVSRYVSDDGVEFKQKEDCIEYERIAAIVDGIESKLIGCPDDIGFANGQGYVQQDSDAVKQFESEMVQLLSAVTNDEGIQKAADVNIFSGWCMRYCSDSGKPILRKIYSAAIRLTKISKDLREYGQPYYANHPWQASGGKLNP